MSDLISRKFLLSHECEADRMGAMLVVGKGWILEAPAVEAVEVVFCKDCLKRNTSMCHAGHEQADTDYCSHGERRESEVSE